MSVWYYADARNERQGPVTPAELVQLRLQGALGWDTLVWREGMGEWQPMRDFAGELAQADDQGARMLSTGDGTVVAQDPAAGIAASAAEPFSPYAPPASAIASHAAIVRGGEVVYAGFWKRFAAIVIDGFVTATASWIVQIPLFVLAGVGGAFGGADALATGSMALIALGYLIGLVIPLVYTAWMQSSSHQATLGKMAVGIKVCRGDGERITFLRAVGRYFAQILSALPLGVGYLMAGFTERKQALHDMLCDTLVVDKWAFTDRPEWQERGLGTVTVVILVLFGLFIAGALAVGLAMLGLISSMKG